MTERRGRWSWLAGSLALAALLVGCAVPSDRYGLPANGSGSEPVSRSADTGAAADDESARSRDWSDVTFAQVVAQSPSRIDIGLASVVLAREAGFATLDDIRWTVNELDELAETALRQRVVNLHMYDDLPERLKRERDMRNARRLVEFIAELGFRFDATDPDGHNIDNLFLHTVLRRRVGYCVSLTKLAVALAWRLQVPVHAVRVPGHMFLRYGERGNVDPYAMNFEMTAHGRTREASYYMERFHVHVGAMGNGVYMHNLNARELFSDVCSNLGSLMFLRGDFEMALHWYDQAMACDPKNAQVYYNLGTTYARMGRPTDAVEAFRQAIELDPGDYLAMCGRGRLYIEAGDPTFGFEDLERAIQLRPNDPHAYRLRGALHARAGDLPLAKGDLLRAMELDDRDADTVRNLALVYLHLGEIDEAVALRPAIERLHRGDAHTEEILRVMERVENQLEER